MNEKKRWFVSKVELRGEQGVTRQWLVAGPLSMRDALQEATKRTLSRPGPEVGYIVLELVGDL